jgi:hypothetical protein
MGEPSIREKFVLKHLAESGRILLDLSAYIPRHSSYLSFLGIALEDWAGATGEPFTRREESGKTGAGVD